MYRSKLYCAFECPATGMKAFTTATLGGNDKNSDDDVLSFTQVLCSTPASTSLGLSTYLPAAFVSVSVLVDRAFVGGSTLSFWYRPDLILEVGTVYRLICI